MDVGFPELLRGPAGLVAAQQVGAVTTQGVLEFGDVPRIGEFSVRGADVDRDEGMRLGKALFETADGFENLVQQALPELKKRNIPATVFVISDALGKAFGPAGRTEKVMSLEQLRSLPAELISIGSHTVTHPMLPLLSEGEARTELMQSRRTLEGFLSRPVLTFSFPFGGFSPRLIELCREAGYDRIFTTLPAFAFTDPGQFVVGRVRVDPTDWPLEFRLKLAGAYRWLPAAFALKRKIVSNRMLRLLFGRKGQADRATEPHLG